MKTKDWAVVVELKDHRQVEVQVVAACRVAAEFAGVDHVRQRYGPVHRVVSTRRV